jgi:hypothetical protein
LLAVGWRLVAGSSLLVVLHALSISAVFADTEQKATPTFNIEEIIGKEKPKPHGIPGEPEAEAEAEASQGMVTEHLSPEMFDEIDKAFQAHFKLASGPTPQALLKQLESPQSVLDHNLKEEFCRYGIVSAQYACYGKTKEAMSIYRWLEENHKTMLAPNSSFFKEVSCAVGLYLCVAGDYTDSNTCLENALKEPSKIKDERQRVSLAMTNFGLARNYHKLGQDREAFKYLAQGKAVNDIAAGKGVTLSPPPQMVRSGYVMR